MTKFHITAKGKPDKCKAILRSCPLGGVNAHYDSEALAFEAIAKQHTLFHTEGKTSPGEVAKSYEKLFTSDDISQVEPLDPETEDSIVEEFLVGRAVNPDSINEVKKYTPPPPPLKPLTLEKAQVIVDTGELLVNVQALQGLRAGIERQRRVLAHWEGQGEVDEYDDGWRQALTAARKKLSNELISKYPTRTVNSLISTYHGTKLNIKNNALASNSSGKELAMALEEDLTREEHRLLSSLAKTLPPTLNLSDKAQEGYSKALHQLIFDGESLGESVYLKRTPEGKIEAKQLIRL